MTNWRTSTLSLALPRTRAHSRCQHRRIRPRRPVGLLREAGNGPLRPIAIPLDPPRISIGRRRRDPGYHYQQDNAPNELCHRGIQLTPSLSPVDYNAALALEPDRRANSLPVVSRPAAPAAPQCSVLLVLLRRKPFSYADHAAIIDPVIWAYAMRSRPAATSSSSCRAA